MLPTLIVHLVIGLGEDTVPAVFDASNIRIPLGLLVPWLVVDMNLNVRDRGDQTVRADAGNRSCYSVSSQ